MHRLLNLTAPEKVVPEIPPEKPEPTPEPKPEPVKPEPTPAPEPTKVVKVVRRDTPLTKTDLEEVLKKRETPEPTKPEVKPEPKPEDDLTGLLDEERSEVELARFAESKNPDKYKDLGHKFSKFFRDNKAKLESMAAEDPDFNPAENADYQAWLKTARPKLTRTERDQLFAQKIKYDTVAELSAKHSKELDEVKRDIKSTRVQPDIDRRATEAETSVLDGLPEDVLAFHKANGNDIAKTEAEFPLEVGVVKNAALGAKRVVAEYFAVREGLKPFDSANNQTHRFIADFILSESDDFDKNGGADKVRGGKQFVTPDKYTPELAKTNWTFSDDDIIDRLKVAAKKEAVATIDAREKEAVKQGFVRAKKTAPKAEVPTPEAAAPKAVASKSGGPVPSQDTPGVSVMQKLLGLKPNA